MFKIEVIKTGDIRWLEVIKKAKLTDFYHTSVYHQLDNQYDSCLFCISEDNYFIALPIVIRSIDESGYNDFTSVYGYPGPIYSHDYNQLPNSLVVHFKEEFTKFCVEQRIVSGFMRLNPLIDQKELMQELGNVVDLNKTISIDLTQSIEEQRKPFRKSLKSELNQLRRKGFSVSVATDQVEIDEFIAIYYETMDRVEAETAYYFSKDYFHNFLTNSEFSTKLLVCKQDGIITAGAIFTLTAKVMQYHLAGTKEAYIKETPMKLILDEARLLGTELGMTDLHLGGGVGGSDDDSLFRFKSGFSKNFKQFSIWKAIFNPEKYQELVKEKNLKEVNSNFFPLYRFTSKIT